MIPGKQTSAFGSLERERMGGGKEKDGGDRNKRVGGKRMKRIRGHGKRGGGIKTRRAKKRLAPERDPGWAKGRPGDRGDPAAAARSGRRLPAAATAAVGGLRNAHNPLRRRPEMGEGSRDPGRGGGFPSRKHGTAAGTPPSPFPLYRATPCSVGTLDARHPWGIQMAGRPQIRKRVSFPSLARAACPEEAVGGRGGQ